MFGKAEYIFGVAERVLGVGEESWILAVLDGRYMAGYVRRWEGVVGGYHPGCWRGGRAVGMTPSHFEPFLFFSFTLG